MKTGIASFKVLSIIAGGDIYNLDQPQYARPSSKQRD